MTISTSLSTLAANAEIKFNETAHQTLALPLLIFFPTARCNSRCVSCAWWHGNGVSDHTLDEIRVLAAELPGLYTRMIRPRPMRASAASGAGYCAA